MRVVLEQSVALASSARVPFVPVRDIFLFVTGPVLASPALC